MIFKARNVGYNAPNNRKKDSVTHYRIHEGEKLDDYRVLWIYSESKARQEREARENKIAKAEQALTVIAASINSYNLKTSNQIEARIKHDIQLANNFLLIKLNEEKVNYHFEWLRNDEAIKADERADGLFPLVDNTALEPVEVLSTYKDQPSLEKLFSNQKSVLEVAPVFLEKSQRIEAMMFLYFIALMLISLIERQMRLQMQKEQIECLPLRPDGSCTKRPTWRTIRDSFSQVHLAVKQGGRFVYQALKGLDSLRQQVLRLLLVPIEVYAQLGDRWWQFALE